MPFFAIWMQLMIVLQMPFVHYWFGWLERAFGPVTLRSNAPRFLAKVAADQTVGFPFAMGAFCVLQPIFQGHGIEGGTAKLHRDWSRMVTSGWCVWIPSQIAIMSVVALNYRPLAMNCVSLGWSMYMSSMN